MQPSELNDTFKTIKEQYGVDPLEGFDLNETQQLLIHESEFGSVAEDVLSNAVQSFESKIKAEADPKKSKEMLKKLENLKKIIERPAKNKSFDLENKYKDKFVQVDKMIESLDDKSKKQLLRNVYINENPKWHPERNSLVHIKIVTSRGIEMNDVDLKMSGIFHDIAKFDTVSLNSQGWPTSLGHDKAGASAASAAGQNQTVVYICNNHMKIKGWKGDSEGGTLNPSTKLQIFNESPGEDNNQKAVNFWKLCVFSKMDDMAYDFNANNLTWKNPTFDKWDEECPLKEEFKKSELMMAEAVKQEKKPLAFNAQEIMAFGAKGPKIGEVTRAISGLEKPEALEKIKQVLGSDFISGLSESKKWITSFEHFQRMKKNNF